MPHSDYNSHRSHTSTLTSQPGSSRPRTTTTTSSWSKNLNLGDTFVRVTESRTVTSYVNGEKTTIVRTEQKREVFTRATDTENARKALSNVTYEEKRRYRDITPATKSVVQHSTNHDHRSPKALPAVKSDRQTDEHKRSTRHKDGRVVHWLRS
ncbi:hypothetical protein FRC12_024933 [Ceratobasidium sp. 428]|nr:hypothetical protein FRC12_024933 [Ceratobasidium sp. 428]